MQEQLGIQDNDSFTLQPGDIQRVQDTDAAIAAIELGVRAFIGAYSEVMLDLSLRGETEGLREVNVSAMRGLQRRNELYASTVLPRLRLGMHTISAMYGTADPAKIAAMGHAGDAERLAALQSDYILRTMQDYAFKESVTDDDTPPE